MGLVGEFHCFVVSLKEQLQLADSAGVACHTGWYEIGAELWLESPGRKVAYVAEQTGFERVGFRQEGGIHSAVADHICSDADIIDLWPEDVGLFHSCRVHQAVAPKVCDAVPGYGNHAFLQLSQSAHTSSSGRDELQLDGGSGYGSQVERVGLLNHDSPC